jgi:hypothetical protein
MRLGPVQRRLLRRAHKSPLGRVMPANWLERRALRRLAARGIAEKCVGLPEVWRVTW